MAFCDDMPTNVLLMIDQRDLGLAAHRTGPKESSVFSPLEILKGRCQEVLHEVSCEQKTTRNIFGADVAFYFGFGLK
jgi:hypothetical protein